MATYPSPTLENLTVNGAATLASSTTSAATISGGTIDNTAIGNTTRSSVKATTVDTTGAATLNSVSSANATLTGGSIDGVTIGASTAAPATVTNLAASGTVSGTGFTNLLSPYPTSSTLAASGGSALIGFLQSGTGAIARTLQSKDQDIVSVKDFGAVGNGTTDDTAAFQAGLDYLNSLGIGTLYIPAGIYKVGALTLYPLVSIRGAGMYATVINPTTAGQTCFSLVSATSTVYLSSFSDFTIYSSSIANVQGFQITLCRQVLLKNICFRGLLNNFTIDRGGYHDIDGCISTGSSGLGAGGSKIWSSTDTEYVYFVGLRRYIIENIGNGVQQTCVYLRRGIGVQLHQVNCNDGTQGGTAQNFIVVENDCQGTKIDQCMSVKNANALLVQTGTGVSVAPSFLTVVNFDADQAQSTPISITSGLSINLIGGSITASGQNTTTSAVSVSGTANQIGIFDMTVNGYSGSGGTGVSLNSVANTHVSGCKIVSCANAFAVTSCTGMRLFDNELISCTAALSGAIAGTGNFVAKNLGWNPIAVTSPAIPATGVYYTNTLGVRCSVQVTGGTITAIYLNGQGMSLSSGVFDVEPGDKIALSYTGTPSWFWIGH